MGYVSPHARQGFINEQLVIVNVTTGAADHRQNIIEHPALKLLSRRELAIYQREVYTIQDMCSNLDIIISLATQLKEAWAKVADLAAINAEE